jgi:membrane protein DedA with SNARE-associated domain
MPFAGFAASQPNSNLEFPYVVLAGVVGTVLGAIPWYYAGKFIGEERLKGLADRHGKWIAVSGKDIEKANKSFYKHGNKAVLIGRVVPGVRTLISIPAGISNMNFLPFIIYSTIGTKIWVILLTSAGYFLGDRYELVDEYFAPVSKIILAILIVAFIIWLVRKNLRQQQ